MMSQAIVLIFAILVVACTAHIGAVGDVQPIDINDPRAVEAIDFAISSAYPTDMDNMKAKIVHASMQVVNGAKFVLIAEVTDTERDNCTVEMFEVWFRGGPPGKFLLHHEMTTATCEQ